MPKFKTIGERCKWEEKTFCHNPYLMSEIPTIIRIDGKGFHKFTQGLEKPFDENLVNLMIATTNFLVKETAAVWGYTQSDEITLCLLSPDEESDIFFDGKADKIKSVIASMTAAYFNSNKFKFLPVRQCDTLAVFDARAFNVPTIKAAVRQYIWRENDATRNSLSMLCQSKFSHNVLQGKKRPELHDLLNNIGVNWNDLPSKYKRGTIVRRVKRGRVYGAEEIEKLPLNHEARKNLNLEVVRSTIEAIDLPPLGRVINKAGVLFKGENPILKNEVEVADHD